MVIEIKKHEKFAFVLKVVLTLSHGQTAAERSFSLGKSTYRTNITEELIIAKKNLAKSFASQQVNLLLFKVPCKLVVSCNSAYGQYKASLEEKAKEAEKAVEKERRELFQEELNRLID